MQLIDYLNPWKTAWYNKDEWVKQDEGMVLSIVDEHEASWDVHFVEIIFYKNKDTEEERARRIGEKMDYGPGKIIPFEKTVFEDPHDPDVSVSFMGSEISLLEDQIDTHDGPKYE
jgi:hypothetical protein